MEISKENTEAKILDAARAVFLEKGFDGARMQEIANAAQINKGLLHYYFKTKDALFAKVFGMAFGVMIKRFGEILNGDLPLFPKIETFCSLYISTVSRNPYLPRFVINELSKNPDALIGRLKSKSQLPTIKNFDAQIKAEIKAGNIRPIDARQLIANIMGMSVFPIIAKPMLQMILAMSEKEYQAFIEERKTEVASFVIHSIRLENPSLKQEEKL